MHIYKTIHVLLSTLSYMFRRLLCHPQGELYRKLKSIVALFDYRRKRVLIMHVFYCICVFCLYIQNTITVQKCSSLHVKCPLFLCDCNWIWIFSTVFRKNTQISILGKICPEIAEFFHADRQAEGLTDGRTNGRTYRHDEAISRFSQFCESA
jgi:hypothetical protein